MRVIGRRRILRYFKGTTHMGIHYAAGTPIHLQGFSDAD